MEVARSFLEEWQSFGADDLFHVSTHEAKQGTFTRVYCIDIATERI